MKNKSKNKDYGYIIMYRDTFFNNSLYFAEPFSKGQALMDLHLLANHTDSCFDIRGIRIDVSKGEIARSVDSLATRWKWSKKKVVNFLKRLEKEDTILLEKSNIINKIKLKDYQKGTTEEPTEEIQREQQRGYRRDTKGTHTINEETNEVINDIINDIINEKINTKESKPIPKPKIDNQKDFDLIFEDAIKTIPTLQKENWDGFIEMRKAIKKPLTSFGARGLKNKLIDLAKKGSDPNDVLSYSAINSYQGVFETKEKKEVKVIKPWWEDFQPTFMGWDRFVLSQAMPENITAEEKKAIEKWIEKAKAENIITLEREAHIKRMREAEEEKKKKQQEIDDYYKKHPPREWPKPEKKPIVEIPPEEKEFSDELKKMIENL